MASQKKARVLIDTTISGKEVKCGSVVSADEAEINSLNKQGLVDSAKAAVDYALKDGATIIEILPVEDQEPSKVVGSVSNQEK